MTKVLSFPSLVPIRPRSLSTKFCFLVVIFTFVITLYTFSPPISFSIPFRLSNWPFSSNQHHGSCTPEQWSSGRWIYSPTNDLETVVSSPEEALFTAGFAGCASDREIDWHQGTDQLFRYPKVSSYKWVPSSQCDVRPLHVAEMIKDMVENGGWFLIGDSITEGHFFSLSCLLSPHVRATPNFTENPWFDRAWQQNLYLLPSSPLLKELVLPPTFSIQDTPIVSFRRVDLLLNTEDLTTLYHNTVLPGELTDSDRTKPETLFGSGEAVWTLSPAEYMPAFLAPSTETNYGTLIVSTAGHWTTTLLSAFRDEEAGEEAGYGVEEMVPFFKVAMRLWATEVQDAIQKYRSNGGTRQKQVIVRAYLPGHEDCHKFDEPTTTIMPWINKWFNWPWIADFNKEFQDVLSSSKFPDIFYLPIERPGRLRPDSHVSGDCLHIISGAGVIEGWSHYIWHFVTREIVHEDRPPPQTNMGLE